MLHGAVEGGRQCGGILDRNALGGVKKAMTQKAWEGSGVGEDKIKSKSVDIQS